jgi:glycosyltransferase involved in cell wall biosynthesis
VRLLFLTFYFAPDLSAGSFRASALARALRERASPDTSIDVVTTLPNRYSTFAREAPELEQGVGWELRRVRLPAHRSDMVGQARAFAAFARAARAHVARRGYDVVFATSSRLMTAALGAWIARQKRARLYLDIRDIFVDTIADVLPGWAAWPMRGVFSAVESWTVRQATHLNFVSRGFEGYFRARYGALPVSWFTNGVDEEFAAPVLPAVVPAEADGRIRILYAGNIGEGQGLHQILPQLALALRSRARFIVIGDGGRRRVLEAAVAAAAPGNVEFKDPMPRAELLAAYRDAHVLFLHLGNLPAFEKVLPSKLFEYAALGKPVLAGVGGYAARFVREEITNAAVFAPGDAAGAVQAFRTLTLQDQSRPEFIAKYARGTIVSAMAEEILALGRAP